jgi:hypothetical protein
MLFRRILRGNDPDKLDQWLDNAQSSGVSSIGQFARVRHRDVDAVKNVITEKWSYGQAEGQINRLKTQKRAMYGRAGVEVRALACSPSHNPRARKVTQTPIRYGATRAIWAIFLRNTVS